MRIYQFGTVADQCRAMGLEVGDTIEGTESNEGWWNTTRLTLLWLGETHAAWRVTDRSSNRPQWSDPRETTDWTLSYREWSKISSESSGMNDDTKPGE